MNDPKAQIVEKLKSASNILVTVSADPSVDQLAALIAMTMLLNKYKKNATAVFSGKIPSVLSFLNPNDKMEKTTDSLRDFIISLDKSKADKLRYKVEDDVVKIFITPYKTSITSNDLKYSAGDFNIDVILALGVHHQQDLDTAITAHGRIFHDAVTLSINNTPGGDFGVTNWEEFESSSLSELVASLIDGLDANLLDAEIATALLTGIVAETGRFSNEKTHPRTMTVSSKLLEAGANQQLVNTQLQDLIGVVTNLQAGAEIKPTADTSNEPLHHNDVADELLIGEDGSFNALPTIETKKTAEVGPPADLELPDVNKAAAAESSAQSLASIESLLGTPAAAPDAAPAKPETVPQPAASPEVSEPSEIESDADAAREAIENALVANAKAEADALVATQAAAAAAAVQPQTNPLIQGIANNQPSYDNPNTTTQYEMPVIPKNEPAPLGMSPADQPFTMPMPPTSSMPGSSQQGIDPNAPQQNSATPPPPLPPPMNPPNFG